MKILYVDYDTTGHHQIYFETITRGSGHENIFVLPHKLTDLQYKQYEIKELSRNLSLSQYWHIMWEIKKIIQAEKPDMIHFLAGDMLYRYFGLYLNTFKAEIVITFHHVDFRFLKKISYICIFKKIKYGVIHTDYIYTQLVRLGINNAKHIEYPCMEKPLNASSDTLKQKYGIFPEQKVILAFGETRYDKGLDILLQALTAVPEEFKLIIAGNEKDIRLSQITDLISSYRRKVITMLYYIPDSCVQELFALCDIVVLPYRKNFSGASGPLTNGVANGKMIIGPKNNSIGDIIETHHLGLLFEAENITSLTTVIREGLSKKWSADDKARKYSDQLLPESFANNYWQLYQDVMK